MLRHGAIALLVGASLLEPGCTPTAPSPGGPTTGCALAPAQNGNDLRINCRITGPLPNSQIDPAHSGSSSCSLTSFTLFDQTLNVPITAIYGENGDDNNARVRMGVVLAPGNHMGRVAKSAGNNCGSTIGPAINVNTNFAGRHIALVDKGQTPACVFQSRLNLTTFNQTLSAGLNVDVSAVTRSAVTDTIARRMDLEMAKAVNGLLQPNANVNEPGFVGRAGRCANGYTAFVGN